MNAEIIRGFTDAIILNILNESDSYGYMITKKIMEITNNEMNIENATIYMAFRRMEKIKLITSYITSNVHGVNRKYYKITSDGKKYLENKKLEWIHNREILNKLMGDLL